MKSRITLKELSKTAIPLHNHGFKVYNQEEFWPKSH